MSSVDVWVPPVFFPVGFGRCKRWRGGQPRRWHQWCDRRWLCHRMTGLKLTDSEQRTLGVVVENEQCCQVPFKLQYFLLQFHVRFLLKLQVRTCCCLLLTETFINIDDVCISVSMTIFFANLRVCNSPGELRLATWLQHSVIVQIERRVRCVGKLHFTRYHNIRPISSPVKHSWSRPM